MKSRLFIVDSATIETTKINKTASIFCPDLSGQQWVKTIADIMADLLQIELGDYIFLWERKNGDQKSRIHGVYRAISRPYFDNSNPNDRAPFKIKIEEAYHFEEPIEEYEVLNCPFIKESLWTIMGKKVAEKPRGSSPLSKQESKMLITLLMGKNHNWTFEPPNEANYEFNTLKRLVIDYSKCGDNPKTCDPSNLAIESINFFKPDKDVRYEKILETIFNQEATNRNNSFFSQLGIDINKVIWYCNYLPYSLERSEMDYVMIESEDGENVSKIYVIEFMTGNLDIDHLHRVCMYSKWVNNTLALGTNFVYPIVISHKSPDFRSNNMSEKEKDFIEQEKLDISTYNINPVKVYNYDFSSGKAKFSIKK